jgi:hypothetical protein
MKIDLTWYSKTTKQQHNKTIQKTKQYKNNKEREWQQILISDHE